jgi:hypothetical protein
MKAIVERTVRAIRSFGPSVSVIVIGLVLVLVRTIPAVTLLGFVLVGVGAMATYVVSRKRVASRSRRSG